MKQDIPPMLEGMIFINNLKLLLWKFCNHESQKEKIYTDWFACEIALLAFIALLFFAILFEVIPLVIGDDN